MKHNYHALLRQHFADHQLYTDRSDCWTYGYDNSRRHGIPDAVIFAQSQDDIVTAVKICYENTIPLIARGRATGTTGGAVPQQGGVILSLERMQQIISVDPTNRLMVVEPGVLNATVQTQAKHHGLFWGPDPSSAAYCSVGGNLACNAAGPRSLKYGATRENTLGLTAVIGNGDIITCGTHTSKSATGYDLTRLFIGSEGTLGIITQASLKLTPLAPTKRTLRILYRDVPSACAGLVCIMSQSITPSACEILDGNALMMIRNHTQHLQQSDAGAMIILEVDGCNETIEHDVAVMQKAATHPGLVDMVIARTLAESDALWAIRKSLSQALRSLSPHKVNEDVVVPIAQLATLLEYTEQLSAQFSIPIVNFGHGGNGNIHVNLLADPYDPQYAAPIEQCLALLFNKVLQLQGCLSGEHGIGVEKRAYLSRAITPATMQLMHNIKKQCDPRNILNPGKLLP